jgi:hypothetical protein
MNRLKLAFVALGTVAALTIGAIAPDTVVLAAPAAQVSVPATAAEHAAEAARYEQEAIQLEQKSQQHEAMAKAYQTRSSGGGKQAATLASLVEHCRRLGSLYADAAAEARATAKSHREMSEAK